MNAYVDQDEKQETKHKRRVHQIGNRLVLLDTRYTKQKAAGFQIELKCPIAAAKVAGKCTGKFLNGDKPDMLIVSTPKLFDRRPEAKRGHAELSITNREFLNLIARVFKEDVPLPSGGGIKVSASGELKFFREDPLFILDAGADEQLPLINGVTDRIAALEIKIRCAKQ